jgi:uncharacterized RmlC-like cupin family protein
MRKQAARLITAAGMVLVTSTALVTATGAAAGASTSPVTAATKELFRAGYHFTVAKGTASLTVKGTITVPTISCGSGDFVLTPELVAHYRVGTSLDTASAQIALSCVSGIPIYGDAVLDVGNKTVNVPKEVSPGENVAITITITKSSASVKIVYATTASDSSAGGTPNDVEYPVGLPSPPTYSPVKFSGCTVNGKSLGSYQPSAWEAVNKSGKVIGVPSSITGGTAFSVTE